MMRTAADRVAELLEVFTQRSMARLRAEFTEEVVAHSMTPTHSGSWRTARTGC